MTDNLTYHGRELQFNPVNMPLSEVARLIDRGQTVLAILEPGDATSYMLLITPLWTPGVRAYLGAIGMPMHLAAGYLHITKLDAEGGSEGWFAAPEVGSWDLEHVKNEWSRELLAWWSRRLWRELKRLSI